MIGYVNWLLYNYGQVVGGVMDSLPSSPFAIDSAHLSALSVFMGYASYFLPIHEGVQMLALLVPAVLGWYVVSVGLRWIKVDD